MGGDAMKLGTVALVVIVAAAFLAANFSSGETTLRAEQRELPSAEVESRVDDIVWAQAVQRWHEELAWYEGILAARHAAWEALHNCEQPGDWYAAGSTAHGYFEGGLGIMASLYQEIAGHSALQDSPEQQIAVGEVVLSRFGAGAWACPLAL